MYKTKPPLFASKEKHVGKKTVKKTDNFDPRLNFPNI